MVLGGDPEELKMGDRAIWAGVENDVLFKLFTFFYNL